MKKIFSGGAKGSDYLWSIIGKEYGYTTYSYSFKEHKVKGGIPIVVDLKTLMQNDEMCKIIAKRLHRVFPSRSTFIRNLIRRNISLSSHNVPIVAIAPIRGKHVKGGTGWAVEHGIIINVPVYVYDDQWYMWHTDKFIPWDVPEVYGDFVGIGSRNIEVGKTIDIMREFFETNLS